MQRAMDSDSDCGSKEEKVSVDYVSDKKELAVECIIDPAAEELNDGFFDLHDVEAFADEEEDMLVDTGYSNIDDINDDVASNDSDAFETRKSLDRLQKKRKKEKESADEKSHASRGKRKRYRDDEDVKALMTLYKDTEEASEYDADDDDEFNALTAEGYFGPPTRRYHDSCRKKNETRGAYQWGDNQDDTGNDWNQPSDEDSYRSVNASDSNDSMNEEHTQRPNESRAGQSSKLLKQTEILEKEMLAEKPWSLFGESKGTDRPFNSLLDSTPEFEFATKMAPVITEDHTLSIEDMIKKRILAEDWDDVIPRELPDVGWSKRKGETPEVSQEKSKLSLGELYEREYLKKVTGYDVNAVEKQSEEETTKSEIRMLFANLCSRLDALSNYHFAPRPVADEAEVKTVTTPAIAMEEVLPLHVSNARVSAPEDIFATKHGRGGILRGDSEMDQVSTLVRLLQYLTGHNL
jgi:U3 small nucleolar RNA-associated protein MPP10